VQLVGGVSHGTLALSPDGSFVYRPEPGYAGPDSFSYRVTDGSATSDVVTVAIHVNDPPRLDLDADDDHATGTGYVTTYVERGPGVAIVDGDVSLSDSDDSQLARVTVTLANAQAGDHLVINGALPAGITAAFDGSRIILSGAAGTAAYESALKQITFTNSEGSIGLDDRTVTIVANDGLADSNVATTTIHATPYDDPPIVTRLLENDNVRENQGFQVVATFTVNDVDTAAGLSFSVLNPQFPWYEVRAASGTVYGQPGNYEIVTQGHFVFAEQNADGDPTVTKMLTISDGNSTIEVPFTFTVTQLTAAPQPQTDLVKTNAMAGQLIAIPDEVLLRNDLDADSTLSIRNAGGDVFGGNVVYTLPGGFTGAQTFFSYSAFDGALNIGAAVIVTGTAGPVINGTTSKDILVADVPSQSQGNLTVSPYGNPFVFGEGQLVNEYVGQTFVASGGPAHNVQFGLQHVSGGDVRFRVMIAEVDSAADPDPNQVLFTSEVLTLKAGAGATAFDVRLDGLQLEAGRSYALILDAYAPDGIQGVASVLSNENGYANGDFLALNPDGGTSAEHFNADWSTSNAWDMAFRITSTAGAPTGSTLNGGRWDDSLIGDIGNDTLNGDEEDDWLYGRDGDDVLNGGTGNDRLIGGRGADQLHGGTGADRFELDAPHGMDRILDFNAGEGDVIALEAEAFGLTAGASAGSIFGASGNAAFDYANGEKLHFDQSTDTLWYDGDGAAGAAAVALARLENGADLQAGHIQLV
jgi:Ca2+-binding RTX toxin-like protein